MTPLKRRIEALESRVDELELALRQKPSPKPEKPKKMSCTFCGVSQDAARKLIASPGMSAFICERCVVLCVDIIANPSAPARKEGAQ